MATQVQDQLALDERVIPDAELEAALEARQEQKEALAEVRAEYRQADKEAMALAERLELPEDVVARVGRFRLERKTTPARHVEFDAEAKERIAVSLVHEEE